MKKGNEKSKKEIDGIDKELDVAEHLQLLSVYQEELKFRDDMLWKQTYRFFYATLIVTLLPNIPGLIDLNNVPFSNKLFPVLGIVMSIFFGLLTKIYGSKLKASVSTYNKMLDALPEQYHRTSLDDFLRGALSKLWMLDCIPIVLFLALTFVCIMMLIGSK